MHIEDGKIAPCCSVNPIICYINSIGCYIKPAFYYKLLLRRTQSLNLVGRILDR
jgi:hypothetical protein